MMAALTDLRDPTDPIEKMRLCNKGIAQGWGRLVPHLVLKIVRHTPVISCTNYLNAPEGAAAMTEESSAVTSEQGLVSGAATVSKMETVRGDERKGRGKKK